MTKFNIDDFNAAKRAARNTRPRYIGYMFNVTGYKLYLGGFGRVTDDRDEAIRYNRRDSIPKRFEVEVVYETE